MSYFNGRDGKPINKGDRCKWDGDNDTIWIIAGEPSGISMYDNYHPDSDYMSVYAKPEDEKSDKWTVRWVLRKTKGFTKI